MYHNPQYCYTQTILLNKFILELVNKNYIMIVEDKLTTTIR